MPRCRFSLFTVVLLVALQGAAVMLLVGWYGQGGSPCSGSGSSSFPGGKVHVLIMSSWRSGSSFLGQTFSQHPSVFYLMEPAWHVWTELASAGTRTLRMAVRDLVRAVFSCDLSALEVYLPERHNVSSLFMWSHSHALCSPPACALGVPGNRTTCEQRCGDATRGLRAAEESCRAHSHVVLKEVRFFELESLYPLLRDPALDLRIVHLVRDPRAVLRSREESASSFVRDSGIVLEHRDASEEDTQFLVMQEVCRSHVRIHELAALKPPDFLKGRYMMVRYEDMVRNPLEEIGAMYAFVGLEMTLQLEEWIYRVTHGKGKGSKKDAFEITSRNAEDVSLAWRSTLGYDKVKRVQNMCKGAMSMLGYRTLDSAKEQKRLDVDLLVPKEQYQFSWLPDKLQQK